MSQFKKALDKARAEELIHDRVEEPGEMPGAEIGKKEMPISCTRTRVVDVSAADLLKRRIVAVEDKSYLSDQFKRLSTRLLRQTRRNGWNTIQVTGFGAEEGKSLVAVNLAISIAHDTRQTAVLVELDFRRPTMAQLLGLSPKTPGLTSYFYEGAALEDLFVSPGIPKLAVLTAGGHVSRSTELVGSAKMEALIKELKHRHDDRYVILDTPGIGVCSDALVIGEYVDAILLVARVDATSQESIRAAMAHINRGKVLGVVLNDVSPKDTNGYY